MQYKIVERSPSKDGHTQWVVVFHNEGVIFDVMPWIDAGNPPEEFKTMMEWIRHTSDEHLKMLNEAERASGMRFPGPTSVSPGQGVVFKERFRLTDPEDGGHGL